MIDVPGEEEPDGPLCVVGYQLAEDLVAAHGRRGGWLSLESVYHLYKPELPLKHLHLDMKYYIDWNHPMVKNAEILILSNSKLSLAKVKWQQFIPKLPNQAICLNKERLPFDDVRFIIYYWMSSQKPIGTFFSFDTRVNPAMWIVQRLLETEELRAVSVNLMEEDERPIHPIKLSFNDSSDLLIRVRKSGLRYEDEAVFSLKIVKLGFSIPISEDWRKFWKVVYVINVFLFAVVFAYIFYII